MFTKEDLLSASSFARSAKARGSNSYKGVLTNEEALERAERFNRQGTLVTITHRRNENERIFFFSDDHCFGYPILPDGFVPCTSVFPMYVKPRPGVEDGWVNTIEKFIAVFHYDARQINSIEELVEYLNSDSSRRLINELPVHSCTAGGSS